MKESDRPMYYGAQIITFETARLLRKSMTYHEKLLWNHFKGKRFCGLRFRRQHPIGFFIADFYCHKLKLVVELDGAVHNGREEYDDGRSAEMEKYGIQVVRFTNSEVESDIDSVLERLEKIINERKKNLF
ncbi:MAG TPA: DUF559 domain-containing protein [Bacteroidales bacterium]|nr:DUF559 domain-containing protein [Bacteroidales bacterium]